MTRLATLATLALAALALWWLRLASDRTPDYRDVVRRVSGHYGNCSSEPETGCDDPRWWLA
jgi:hypothetical protein